MGFRLLRFEAVHEHGNRRDQRLRDVSGERVASRAREAAARKDPDTERRPCERVSGQRAIAGAVRPSPQPSPMGEG